LIVTFILNGESVHSCADCDDLSNIGKGKEIIIKGTKYTVDNIDISINGKISKKVYLVEVE